MQSNKILELYKHVPALPHTTVDALSQFRIDNVEILCRFMMKRLKYAIENNLEVVHLFRIQNSMAATFFLKANYTTAIDAMMDMCKKVELYEMMHELQSLKDKHHANLLMDTTITI